ncbi:hypothetical protein [Burkholderia gladioli]|jgi:hypothetical protein|uniref:hypothetical protein n=1 Tax=Burkholderia gladioli TaxID=28095 RepID=UPI00163A4EE8|nr:hypothetical protein [Burkholderia gladioli]
MPATSWRRPDSFSQRRFLARFPCDITRSLLGGRFNGCVRKLINAPRGFDFLATYYPDENDNESISVAEHRDAGFRVAIRGFVSAR